MSPTPCLPSGYSCCYVRSTSACFCRSTSHISYLFVCVCVCVCVCVSHLGHTGGHYPQGGCGECGAQCPGPRPGQHRCGCMPVQPQHCHPGDQGRPSQLVSGEGGEECTLVDEVSVPCVGRGEEEETA
eukprot:1146042-Pelagomonas_calceolata.AAC.5